MKTSFSTLLVYIVQVKPHLEPPSHGTQLGEIPQSALTPRVIVARADELSMARECYLLEAARTGMTVVGAWWKDHRSMMGN